MVKNEAVLIKSLRELNGAPMLKCKEALRENGNDLEKADQWLKLRGFGTSFAALDTQA